MNQENDLKKIKKLTDVLYNSICFEIGGIPPVENLRDILLPSANMIRNDGENPDIMTIDDFITSFRERIADGTIKSFYEGELNEVTEIFGSIAHRFSIYETKFDLTIEDPFSIGINSIQYVKNKGGWKISSIAWNNQTDDLRIPKRYLP
jgi:hypothetical protein